MLAFLKATTPQNSSTYYLCMGKGHFIMLFCLHACTLPGLSCCITQSGVSELVLFPDPTLPRKEKGVWHTSGDFLGLLSQHFQKSGGPITITWSCGPITITWTMCSALSGGVVIKLQVIVIGPRDQVIVIGPPLFWKRWLSKPKKSPEVCQTPFLPWKGGVWERD